VLFQFVRHILVVILFVPQRAQQVEQLRPGVLPLLAHGLDEFLAEGLEEVAVADFRGVALERLEG